MHPADDGFLDGRGLITSELSFTLVCSADVYRCINDHKSPSHLSYLVIL